MVNETIREYINGYSKALVIFIDILGSKSRSNFSELFEINELFHSELLDNKNQDRDYTIYQRHIFTFSDCAYIFYDYKDGVENCKRDLGTLFEVALVNCEPLLMKFLSKGLIFRGGVAYGNVYYEENRNMFFGEAVNKAYLIESKEAKYPRIVVENFVANSIIQHYKDICEHFERENRFKHLPNPKKDEGCIVRQDSDGQYHLNYLNQIQQGSDYSLIIGKSNQQFISDILLLCDKQISLFQEEESICSKYEWLKMYIENSSNSSIKKSVVYQKLIFDDLISEMTEKDYDALLRASDNPPFFKISNMINAGTMNDFDCWVNEEDHPDNSLKITNYNFFNKLESLDDGTNEKK